MLRVGRLVVVCSALALIHEPLQAAIVQTITDSDFSSSGFSDDGSVGSGEYTGFFSNGGGGGFGGTVGAGVLHVDSDATNIYFGFDPGADLNDVAVLYLDTRLGGFTDLQMNDRADGGRSVASNLTRDSNDTFPILPDFAVLFAPFGTVVFELTTHAGDELTATNGHLTFHIFEGDQTGNSASLIREIGLPRALLGNPSTIDMFMAYTAESMFNSNESLPGSALNANGNPATGTIGGTVVYDNANRFIVAAIPEPGSVLFFAVAACLTGAGGCIRRRRLAE